MSMPPPPSGGPAFAAPGQHPPPPPNHLVMAIVTTLLCCIPAGIVSIVYANQVNTKYQSGDYDGAVAASNNARIWWIVAIVAGVVVGTIYFAAVAGSS